MVILRRRGRIHRYFAYNNFDNYGTHQTAELFGFQLDPFA
jgi:hypothetical protein